MAKKLTGNSIYDPEMDLGEFSQWNAFIEPFAGYDIPHAQVPYYIVVSGGSIDTGATYTIKFVDEDGTLLQISTLNAGTIPTYTGTTPTKEETVGYKYTFAGWKPSIAKATKDATYTAYYTEVAKKFDLVVNGETYKEVAYGTTVSISALTKEILGEDYLDAQKYTVVWTDASGNPVDNNATFVMNENGLVLNHTESATPHILTFYDEDGNILETISTSYGTTITGTPDVPTKTGYTGIWKPAVPTTCPAYDMEIKPVYTAIKYTIIFQNYDGTQLSKSQVAYDTTPVYTGATPKRATTVEYTYTFNGWDKEVTKVTGDTTYTATYTEEINYYDIQFYNYDGEWLQTSHVSAHTMPEYTGIEPTKPEDAEYTYTFNTWSPAIVEVTKNATYTATYTSTRRSYDITFVLNNGEDNVVKSVEYGQVPTCDEPSKASTERYDYSFSAWNPTIVAVTGPKTYNAIYEETIRQYAFQVNGKIPPRMINYGTVISLADEAKSVNEDYTDATKYTVAISDTSGNTYTTADTITITGPISIKINGTAREYLASYVDWDNTVLASATTRYNDKITLVEPTPTREGYSFTGWSTTMPETMPNKDVTAKAEYEINSYTITYYVDGVQDGAVETYEYNAPIVIRADKSKEGYTFSGWDKVLPSTMPAENIKIYGTFSINSYKLTFNLDGAEYSAMTVEYNSVINKPTVTPASGYSVSEWESTDAKEYTNMPAKDLTYTAETSKVTVKVTFEIGKTGETTDYDTYTTNVEWGEPINVYTTLAASGVTNLPEEGEIILGDDSQYYKADWEPDLLSGTTFIPVMGSDADNTLGLTYTLVVPASDVYFGYINSNEIDTVTGDVTTYVKTTRAFDTFNVEDADDNFNANVVTPYSDADDYEFKLVFFVPEGNDVTKLKIGSNIASVPNQVDIAGAMATKSVTIDGDNYTLYSFSNENYIQYAGDDAQTWVCYIAIE